MRTYWMFYFYSLTKKKKRSIDGLREVQEPSIRLCKTCICSFVEQIHPFWKFSRDLRRQKNMSSQCEQYTVYKYPMDTGTLSYTGPGCSVLSSWQLHFPQLRTGRRLTQKDIFSHTNIEAYQAAISKVYLIHPSPTGTWSFHELQPAPVLQPGQGGIVFSL